MLEEDISETMRKGYTKRLNELDKLDNWLKELEQAEKQNNQEEGLIIIDKINTLGIKSKSLSKELTKRKQQLAVVLKRRERAEKKRQRQIATITEAIRHQLEQKNYPVVLEKIQDLLALDFIDDELRQRYEKQRDLVTGFMAVEEEERAHAFHELARLLEEIQVSQEEERYEDAAKLRDEINELRKMREKQE